MSVMRKLFSATALGSILASPALAQIATAEVGAEHGFSSDDIIVTAQRREQSLMSVPVAITAITAENIANVGLSDSSQLGAVVPNLKISSSYGKTQPNFTLRGIGVGNEYGANQASPIGVYFDDAYIASRTSQGAQLFDLERIEVLRGPQGTLFGRNTTGGAINFITRKPSLSGSNGYLEGSFGNYNATREQVALETTLVEGELGVRVSGTYEHNDPMFRNLLADHVSPHGNKAYYSSPNGGTSYAGRIVLRWQPTSDLEVLLKAYGSKDNLTQGALHQIGATPDGTNPITGYNRNGLGFYEVEYGVSGWRRTNSWGFYGNISYNVNDELTLTSITSYDGGYFELYNDASAQPLSVMTWNPFSRTRQFNQEIRANYSTDRLNAVAGGYYGSDSGHNGVNVGVLFFLRDLGLPADPTGANGGFGIAQTYSQDRKSKAIFGQLDYDVTARLTATLGLRYTWDRAKLSNALAAITDYDFVPIVYSVSDPANYGHPVPDLHGRDGALSGRFALNYTFDNGGILYASYSRGYRSGTFNGNAYLSNEQLDYIKPETVDAFEAGTKGRLLDGAVSYSLAAFYYKYKNQQTNEIIGPVGFLRNAGKATIYGAELELSGRIMDGLTFDGSFGLLHTRYDELVLGRDAASGQPGVDLSGNRLPFAPLATAQFGIDWTVVRIGSGDLRLLPRVSYSSRQWFSPFNDRESFPGDPIGNGRLQQGAMALVDGQLLWSNEQLTMGFWVKNLFARKYYTQGLDTRSTFGYDFLVPSDPRTYGARLRVNF